VFREHIFSIIAHDLRNPLTAFQDLADLIKYSLVEKRFEDIDEIAEAIDKSSLKLRLLTDNFFQWAFSQQFQLKPNPERIVLLPVIHKIIGYYEHGIMFKKGTFAIDCNELASVYMDAKDLETILRNLIDNAVKMAQVEHPFCSIAVSTDAEKTLIKIKNNGLTIDEKKQSVIQQLFKNNTNIQPYKNDIGFGLWLVANYTHKNKGAISFSSKENDETAFALTFPTDLHSSIDHKH
jgi:K+-sensing histidine kinase KdpD